MKSYIVIFATCANKKEASLIAKRLLTKRLVACANIIDGAKSFFWWKGEVDKAAEALVMMKTVKGNFSKIQKVIKTLHSYEVPEIIALPVIDGEKTYLKWIDESVQR